ncbi:hypothetical protein ACRTDR_07210 [Shewanella algae]
MSRLLAFGDLWIVSFLDYLHVNQLDNLFKAFVLSVTWLTILYGAPFCDLGHVVAALHFSEIK